MTIVFGLSTVALAVSTGVLKSSEKNNVNELEAHYQQAYFELLQQTNDMEVKLSKFLVSASNRTQQEILYDVWKGSEVSGTALAALSARDSGVAEAMKFENQLGDFAYYWAGKLADGNGLDEEAYQSFEKLHEVLKKLGEELGKVQTEIAGGYLFMKDFGGENDVFDGFNLGGRAGHTDLVGVSLNEGSAPLFELEVFASINDSLSLSGELSFLGGRYSAFVFHDTLSVAGATFSGRAVDCYDARQGSLDGLYAVLEAAFHDDVAVSYFEDVFGVGDLREAELLSDLRTHLGGVAVDGLAAAEDDVVVTDFLDSLSQRIRCGEGVGTTEDTVSEDNAGVGATIDCFTNDFRGAGQSHSEHSHCRTGVSVFDAEGLLEGVEVFRVEDSGQGGAVDGAILLHRIFAHVASVRHLLSEHNDV